MRRHSFSFLLLSPLLTSSHGANLFVSHYSGTVYTLTLSNNSDGAYSLTLNTSLYIGGQPSWLTWDSSTRTLYIPDETEYFGTPNAWSVAAATNGALSLTGKATAIGGGVANTLYGNHQYLATAHYDLSQITTFKLPLTSSSTPLQKIALNMTGPGTVPNRQNAAHPHEVLLDPTGAFLLVPDLGADQIRIYQIGSTGLLTACPSYFELGGTGPRHGAFSANGSILYVANELSNSVHTFGMAYNNSRITLKKLQSLTTFPKNATAPTGTKVAEVHVKDNFIYAANRNDLSFSPSDSIASFSLNSVGLMAFMNITSSGGWHPRTFDINKAGDMIAIGDQTSANVAIVKRNITTGELGPQLASLRVSTVGTA
ncbi:putative 6-phosphogluconolactonase [Hyphodiscus hymeniophilus]|uniref:6-phosphogluconolactonase n=1 Tax=Hyphodiscus hymeniophilus TaxID=353542 RepID=A0A9P6VLE0_9HELO|nr:putative 6-phosphogluconolactonase [Hyphodiscus hymeniophilus]